MISVLQNVLFNVKKYLFLEVTFFNWVNISPEITLPSVGNIINSFENIAALIDEKQPLIN